MSERRCISSGSSFEELVGYCRAVVVPDPAGDWIFVSGTTGYDYATGEISPDPVEQARQCFRNLEAALSHADSSMDDVFRIRVFVTSREVFRAVAPVIGDHCRAVRPANTTTITQLVEPEMLIELEVTARRTTA